MKFLTLSALVFLNLSVQATELRIDKLSQAAVLQQLQMTDGPHFKNTQAIDNFGFTHRNPTVEDISIVRELAQNGQVLSFECASRDSQLALCNVLIVRPITFQPTLSITFELDLMYVGAPRIIDVLEIASVMSTSYRPRSSCADLLN